MAGDLAGRMCREGSEPGWTRPRTPAEIVSYHEAGHAVVAIMLGERPVLAEAGASGGRVCFTEEQAARPLGADEPSDSAQVSEWVRVLAVCGFESDLAGLEQNTEAILRVHWTAVERLALQLRRNGRVVQAEMDAGIERLKD